MALINCKECNEKISDSAKACPKCGEPSPLQKLGIFRYFTLLVSLTFGLSFLYSIGALVISLLNRECRFLFSNNAAELYWGCVSDHLTIYYAGNAFKIAVVALILSLISALLIDKVFSKE
jgi:hypothetical protein